MAQMKSQEMCIRDRIYTFTYAGDAQEAVACVRCARTALPEAVVTVVDDSAAPVDVYKRQPWGEMGR